MLKLGCPPVASGPQWGIREGKPVEAAFRPSLTTWGSSGSPPSWPLGPSKTYIFGPGRPQKGHRKKLFFYVAFGGPENKIEKNVYAMLRWGLAPHLFGELPNRPRPPRPSKCLISGSRQPQQRHRKNNFFPMSFLGPGQPKQRRRTNVFAMSRWGFAPHIFGRLRSLPGPPRPSQSSIFGFGKPQKRHRESNFYQCRFWGLGSPKNNIKKTFLLCLGGALPPHPF